jgi:hypothetical protein
LLSLRLLGAAVAVAAFSVAAPAAAKPATLFAKAGLGPAATDAEIKACAQDARSIKANVKMPVVINPNPYAILGGAIAAGFIAGYEQGKARDAAVETCMRGKGFGRLELTPEEDAEVAALKTNEARAGWREAFLGKDIGARVEAALVPAVPQLADAKAEPLVIGGVRFDPAQLATPAGPVALKAPLLTGEIGHRRTATLAEPFDLPGLLKTHADAGAVFHEVAFNGVTAWCGVLASKPPLTGVQHDMHCISTDFGGYQVVYSWDAKPWLVATSRGAPPIVAKEGRLVLKESATDLIGPMNVVVQSTRFTKTGVALEALVFHDGEKLTFWRGEVALDDQGHGVLPFWTHRLQLQKTGKMLTSTLTPDGDGRGWDDLAAEKARSAADDAKAPA